MKVSASYCCFPQLVIGLPTSNRNTSYINVLFNLILVDIYVLQFWVCISTHLNLYKVKQREIFGLHDVLHGNSHTMCIMSRMTYTSTCTLKNQGTNINWGQVKRYIYVMLCSIDAFFLRRMEGVYVKWKRNYIDRWCIEYI